MRNIRAYGLVYRTLRLLDRSKIVRPANLSSNFEEFSQISKTFM